MSKEHRAVSDHKILLAAIDREKDSWFQIRYNIELRLWSWIPSNVFHPPTHTHTHTHYKAYPSGPPGLCRNLVFYLYVVFLYFPSHSSDNNQESCIKYVCINVHYALVLWLSHPSSNQATTQPLTHPNIIRRTCQRRRTRVYRGFCVRFCAFPCFKDCNCIRCH